MGLAAPTAAAGWVEARVIIERNRHGNHVERVFGELAGGEPDAVADVSHEQFAGIAGEEERIVQQHPSPALAVGYPLTPVMSTDVLTSTALSKAPVGVIASEGVLVPDGYHPS